MTHTEISVKMIMDRWYASIKNFDTLMGILDDGMLEKEIAPGKNRGIYLLGHMIAVHDDMLVLLDIGERMYPQLQEPFLKQADKMSSNLPDAATLRSYWSAQCEAMKQKMDALSTSEWFTRHTAVSEEDFIKEPHRNKLNIILTRTTHLQYHIGQLVLLKP